MSSPFEITTVTDDEVTVFADGHFRSVSAPAGGVVDLGGIEVHLLDRPPGEMLGRVATVNDVHFGETVCGLIEGLESLGPPIVQPADEPAYPEVMNSAVASAIGSVADDGRGPLLAVVAKGDLTTNGTHDEYEQFLGCYGNAFGESLVHVRGNHDAYHGADFASFSCQERWVDGAVLAVLDTARPGRASGNLSADQLDWLDELAARADRPVLVFGHHHCWDPTSNERPDDYFGLHPDDSEALVTVVARRRSIVGYFAGHTHRNRVRRFPATEDVPFVEVACTKDFPGAWAEYRIHEGGVLQIVHRVAEPAALAWAERTRSLFGGLYPAYAFGDLDDRCFALPAVV